jgi:hypothetical protein
LFEHHFAWDFGISTTKNGPDGPGMRFLEASVQLMGIMQADGSPYTRYTLRWYRDQAENHNKRGFTDL